MIVTKKTSRTVSNVAERSTKGRRCQASAGKHETYEKLAESTESLKREIVAIGRSAGADPCHRESLESSLGEANEEDQPQSDVETHTRALRHQ